MPLIHNWENLKKIIIIEQFKSKATVCNCTVCARMRVHSLEKEEEKKKRVCERVSSILMFRDSWVASSPEILLTVLQIVNDSGDGFLSRGPHCALQRDEHRDTHTHESL